MKRRSDQETAGEIRTILAAHRGGMRIRRIVQELGLSMDQRRRVRRLLKSLMQDGAVVGEGRGVYRLALDEKPLTGVVVRRGRGQFLVEPDDGSPMALRVQEEDRAGALPGDRVRAAAIRRRHRGPWDGRVIEILARSGAPVVGIYQERPRGATVLPDDDELCGPVRVMDSALDGLEDGLVVAVALEDPSPRSRPRGRIVRILGEPGELPTELGRLEMEHGLTGSFPPNVEDEVRGPPRDPAASRRTDLRGVPHVTIDPTDARDFDDAVFVDRLDDGFRLVVSIADVASFVTPGGAVDREALRRGCSVYLPSRVFPMLPGVLSEQVCTLAPGQDRAAVTVEMQVDGEGAVRVERIIRSQIRSAARLSYAQVQQALDGTPDEAVRGLAGRLQTMADCARALLRAMSERGMLDLDLPEQRISLDEDGWPGVVEPAQRFFAHRIIEAFMIAANEAVAGVLGRAGCPAIYRVHPAPDPEKMETFGKAAASMGVPLPFKTFLPAPVQLARYLHTLRGRPVERAVSQLLLRSLMQARYATACEGHYGLASPAYLHFTSPIRRYPDLAVHRQLGALLDAAGSRGLVLQDPLPEPKDWPCSQAWCERVAEQSSRAERRSLEAERAAADLYQAAYMQDRVGDELDGEVAFVLDFGIFVRVLPSGVEGLVHISRMRDDYYRFDEERLALVGRRRGQAYRIGDKVRVRVESVQLAARQVDLSLVD